jgi:hypothetical protein
MKGLKVLLSIAAVALLFLTTDSFAQKGPGMMWLDGLTGTASRDNTWISIGRWHKVPSSQASYSMIACLDTECYKY